MKKVLFYLPLIITFSGCNPYSKFYTDFTGGVTVLEDSRFIISTSEPKLVRGSDVEKDCKRMFENGYACLGASSFNAGTVNQNSAIEHAKKIHADTAIMYSRYSHTESGYVPMSVPDTQTSTGFHSGSVYGPGGGYAHYSGSSYSTTYGTRTTYIPYSVNRYDYYATFWCKVKPLPLGVLVEDLTDELRKEIASNKGVYIRIVVKDSPAFHNDLLSGDVIRRLNKVEIIDRTHFQELMAEAKGKEIELEIFRQGKTILKQIKLN
jgi:hypothetical protein